MPTLIHTIISKVIINSFDSVRDSAKLEVFWSKLNATNY